MMTTHSLFIAGVLGLGGPEVLLIFAVLMLLFGGSKLPELAKGLGKSIKEFKRASTEEDPPAPVVAAPATLPAAKVEAMAANAVDHAPGKS
jgi:sec-independent protein translocase protein TatA